MITNRKGVRQQLKHFQPGDHQHTSHQSQAPHGHAADSLRHGKIASQRGGVEHSRFANQAPKGSHKGQ